MPVEATGCTASGLSAATVLYNGPSPATLRHAGPSPIVTGDSLVCSGGTSDWTGFNTSFNATDNTFNQFTGPAVAVTATTMAGTVPACVINRNPLTYDIRGTSYFAPGSTHSVTISGHTGSWTGANGTFTATILSHGRFSIPVDASGYGSAVGQVPTITTARPLDWPAQTLLCTAGCSVQIPVLPGTSWARHRYYDTAGTELFDSGRYSFTDAATTSTTMRNVTIRGATIR